MTSRWVSSTSMTPRVPTMPISNPYTAPGHTVGSAQLMFMLNTTPSSIVKMPDVPSFVPIGSEGAIGGAGVHLDGPAALHQPHAHVEAVRAGDHHGRQARRVGHLAQRRLGHHAVHEGAGDNRCDIADLAVAQTLLDRLEPSTEPLGVADDGVDARVLDGREHPRGVDRIRREGLLDEQRHAEFDRAQDRLDVHLLVGRDDDRPDLGPGEQLAEVGGGEVRIGVGGEVLERRFVDVAQAEPADPGIFAGEHRADPADRAAADDRQPDGAVCRSAPVMSAPAAGRRSRRR